MYVGVMDRLTVRRRHRPQAELAAKNAIGSLDYEIAQAKASAIGRLGRALEVSLRALAEFDAVHGTAGPIAPALHVERAMLVAAAQRALWQFVVQREACGFRDSRAVMRDYRVPREVQDQIGAFPCGPDRRQDNRI